MCDVEAQQHKERKEVQCASGQKEVEEDMGQSYRGTFHSSQTPGLILYIDGGKGLRTLSMTQVPLPTKCATDGLIHAAESTQGPQVLGHQGGEQ